MSLVDGVPERNERAGEGEKDDTDRYLDGLDGLSDISVDERQKNENIKNS